MDPRRPPLVPVAVALAGLLAVAGVGTWWWTRAPLPARPAAANLPAPAATAAATEAAAGMAAPASPSENLEAKLRDRLAAGAPTEEIFAVLRAIAAQRPDLAIDLAHALGRNEHEQAAWVADLAREWTAREPKGAWQWLFRQPLVRLEKLANGNLVNVVADEMARLHDGFLLENTDLLLLTGDKRGPIPPQALVHATTEALIRHGKLDSARDALDRWARDPSRNDVGSGALSAVALGLAEKSREEGGSWLKTLPVTDDRNAALASFAADWVVKDPTAALDWSTQLRPEDNRTAVVQRAYSDWLEEDATKAGQWLGEKLSEAQPPADAEALITNLVHQSALIRKDPAAALRWADLITDPAVRASTQEQLLLRWGARDQVAFERHLAQDNSLPPEKKAVLLQQVRNHHLAPEKSPLWFSADAFDK